MLLGFDLGIRPLIANLIVLSITLMNKLNDLLIVVDVQNGFVNQNSEHVVKPIAAFLEAWLSAGNEAVLTRFINDPGSAWERLIHWTRLRTSPEIDLCPEIQSAIEGKDCVSVVDKRSYSSLIDPVNEMLVGKKPDRVLVCGIATDSCVLKTAVDLFEQGYTPLVLEDLCASHAGREVHDSGLLLISRFIGRDQIVGSSTVL